MDLFTYSRADSVDIRTVVTRFVAKNESQRGPRTQSVATT